ncbi:hypothetical protein [Raoultella planticola]|nr:hypothetical protein [Raoultella planticola]
MAITFNVCLTTFTIIDIYGQADLLDDIKQKKEIVIATEARYAL